MSVPTQGEVFARITERLTQVQEDCSTLGHLTKSMSSSAKDTAVGDGWIAVGEMIKRINFQVIKLGQGKLQ